MAQQNNTMNYILHDSSGQPQMIKLVQSAGKSIGGIMAGISGQSMKLYKATTGQDSTQTFTPVTQAQLMKAPKIVTKTVPISTMAQTFQKSSDGQIIKKTIRLTPQQMQGLKFINTTQKIQIQQSPQSLIKQPIASPTSKQFHTSPPILDHTGGRKRHETMDLEFTPDSKRRKTTEKVGKGLRHFSMKVCEKVRKKGTTSYNEVADELVAEFTNSAVNNSLAEQYDQKNIRRRVYDALNVLMAMNIISKEKKEIRWIGLPSNSVQECIQLEKEKQKKIQSIQEKRKNLQELILNQISFKNLAQRNMDLESCQGRPSTNSYIQLPFIVVNTNRKTVIDCSISQDKMEYLFQFNDKFEIHDDLEILKQIGMLMALDEGKCTAENLEKIKSLVPKALEEYVIQLANGTTSNLDYLIEKGAGPSNSTFINTDDLIETHLDEENSRQSSSCDPLSPGQGDFTDEEVDSDISSDD